MLPGELQDLARPRGRFADRLIAEGRQALAQAGRDQLEVVIAIAGRVAEPDGIHLLDHVRNRFRDLDARERFGEIRRPLRVGVVVMGELGVGEWQLVEGELRIADVLAEKPGRARIDEVAEDIKVDGGMEILGEVPGMAVASLRFAPSAGRDDTDAINLVRRFRVFGGTGLG